MQAIYDMFAGPGAITWVESSKVIAMFICGVCLSVAAIAIRRVYFPLRILKEMRSEMRRSRPARGARFLSKNKRTEVTEQFHALANSQNPA
jgi:hypothetical protein